MKAIILAAGQGKRLENHANNLPKCLLRVGNRKLLDYQLDCLSSLGIIDVVMMLGFRGDAIREHLAHYKDMHFTFLENSEYVSTNTAYSLWLARNEMTDDFLYLNADVLFDPEIIRRLINSPKKNSLAVLRKSTEVEEVKVILDGIWVKSIGKKIASRDAYGEFIGVAKFSKNICLLFASVLDQVITKQGGKQKFFEVALEKMLSHVHIAAIDVTDLPCIEIDFPEDLIEARTRVVYEITNRTNNPPPRVLFYIERNLHLPFLEPIHDYLADHFSVEMAFCSPSFQPAEHGLTGYGLKKDTIKRLKQKSKFYAKPSEFTPDITVIADTCFYPIRGCGKIVNVGHGLISKGWFYTDSPAVRRENCADLICVPGEWHKQILQKNVYSQIQTTGFIKSDDLFNCDAYERESFYQHYHIPRNKKIVLFAPTFNSELSAIPCVKERIVELIDEHTLLLIKLHNMTDQKWVDIYSRLGGSEENVRLIDDRHFAQAMVCTDVMVSDVSSAFVEFMLLDKPVVLFNNPMQKNYAQYDPTNIEYQVRDAGIQVGSIEELKLAVKLSLVDPAQYSPKRKAVAETLNCRIDGKCTERAAWAIMQLSACGAQHSTNNVLFSIIIFWDHAPSNQEITTLLSEIKTKNSNIPYEVIFIGPQPFQLNASFSEIKMWLNGDHDKENLIKEAFNQAAGDFYVWMRPNIILPNLWLKWMYHYFKWYPQAGAVKAMSSRDNYQEILQNVPPDQRPNSLPEIADYFLYVLMGNQVTVDTICNDHACIMLSKVAYEQVSEQLEDPLTTHTMQALGRLLKSNGFSLWNAVEVFGYPKEDLKIGSSMAGFEPNKAIGHHAESFTLPEQTKAIPVFAEKHTHDFVYKSDKSEKKNSVLNFISQAREHKKEKQFEKAIYLLEEAKKLLKPIESNEKQVLSLLEKSKVYKKKEEYTKSIELLEEAKQKIA